MKTCWRASRGCSSATIKRIERIGRDDKRTDEAWERDIFYYINNFCSKKLFSNLNFTTKSSSTEETEDMGATTSGEYSK